MEYSRELSVLNSISVAFQTLDIKHIMEVTLLQLLDAIELDNGAIFMISNNGEIKLETSIGLPEADAFDSEDFVFQDALLKRHITDHSTRLEPESSYPAFHVLYQTHGGQRYVWLISFLITYQGRSMGFFALEFPPKRVFCLRETHFLGALGNFLGSAIQSNENMVTLQKVTRKMFQTQEEEQRRIARELHDEAGQSLTAIRLGLDWLDEHYKEQNSGLAEEIGEIKLLVSRTTAELKRLSHNLHPTLLVDLGLEPALKVYIKEVKKRSNLKVEFNMVGFDQRVNVDLETVLYRFGQEALTNTLKHAQAKLFRLSIIKSYPKIIFMAEDDGIGFDTQEIDLERQSLGLMGMRERVSLLGGVFQLRSRPGRNTRIRIEIPIFEVAQ